MDKLFLVGFMGCGKSTIGRQLAKELAIPFVDTDSLIELKMGMSIADIFREQGEGTFRDQENLLLNELVGIAESMVVATGGGMPCHHSAMDYMNRHGITIYIQLPIEIILARLRAKIHTRPLLATKTQEELTSYVEYLFDEREPTYSKAAIKVDGRLSADALVRQLKQMGVV